MKTVIVILILVLLTVAAFLILIAARWLGLLIESHRRRALHCGQRGVVSIARTSNPKRPCLQRRCIGDEESAQPSTQTSSDTANEGQ